MGNRPSEMMDREKAYIPELQISFMEHIAMPIYKSENRSFRACDAGYLSRPACELSVTLMAFFQAPAGDFPAFGRAVRACGCQP